MNTHSITLFSVSFWLFGAGAALADEPATTSTTLSTTTPTTNDTQLAAAESMVRAVYDEFIADAAGTGHALDFEQRKILSKGLRRAFAHAWKNEMGSALDGDPAIDGNDFDLTTATVKGERAGKRFVVAADFLHNGAPKHVVWTLVEEHGVLKVDDVAGQYGSLRAFLAKRAK
jgi:hypothetical protein